MGVEIIQYNANRCSSIDDFFDDVLEEEREEVLEVIEYCRINNLPFVENILTIYYNNNL